METYLSSGECSALLRDNILTLDPGYQLTVSAYDFCLHKCQMAKRDYPYNDLIAATRKQSSDTRYH